MPTWSRSFASAENDPREGTTGPVPIRRLDDGGPNAVEMALINAARGSGIPWVDNENAAEPQDICIGAAPRNVVDNVRMNGALTYLAAARNRPNLEIIPDAAVDLVTIDGGHASGVRTVDGREFSGREIVLAAGAYGSPAILMRSGIGPADHLRELGIPVVCNLPGVGANLLDHPLAANGFACTWSIQMPPRTGRRSSAS